MNRLAADSLVLDDGKDGWRLRASAFADAVRVSAEAEEPAHGDHGANRRQGGGAWRDEGFLAREAGVYRRSGGTYELDD